MNIELALSQKILRKEPHSTIIRIIYAGNM